MHVRLPQTPGKDVYEEYLVVRLSAPGLVYR